MKARKFRTPDRGRVPTEIGSAQAKLVYHSLDVAGAGDVDELADRLGLKKITLLDILASLDERGHVERRDGRYAPT